MAVNPKYLKLPETSVREGQAPLRPGSLPPPPPVYLRRPAGVWRALLRCEGPHVLPAPRSGGLRSGTALKAARQYHPAPARFAAKGAGSCLPISTPMAPAWCRQRSRSPRGAAWPCQGQLECGCCTLRAGKTPTTSSRDTAPVNRALLGQAPSGWTGQIEQALEGRIWPARPVPAGRFRPGGTCWASCPRAPCAGPLPPAEVAPERLSGWFRPASPRKSRKNLRLQVKGEQRWHGRSAPGRARAIGQACLRAA